MIFLFVSFAIGLSIANDRKLQTENFPLSLYWRIKLDGQVKALSTDEDGLLFIRTAEKIYAVIPQMGTILWEHPISWQGVPLPVVSNQDSVYYGDGKGIWALVKETGSVRWFYPAANLHPDVRSVFSNLVIAEVSGYVYGLDSDDGSLIWHKADCRYGEIQPYGIASTIYIPCINRIRAMDAWTGDGEWEIETPVTIGTYAYQDGRMYYSPNRTSIAAFNLQEHKQEWQTHYHGEGFRQFKVIDEYLATVDEQLCLFDRSSGETLWCTDRIPVPQNPVIINDKVYVFNAAQNQITAMDITDAAKIGELSIRNFKIASSLNELMVSIDDLLVFSSGNIVFTFGD